MQQLEKIPDQVEVTSLNVDTCRKLEFETVELKQIEKGYWIVKVRGVKPHAHMKVELVPEIYNRQPEYWGINIRGCVSEDIRNPAPTPFEVTLPLTAAKGSKGVEICGAKQSKCYDVPHYLFTDKLSSGR